ncbi:hypothetical protein [Mycobacterium lepromatosis]|uniref:hypothetical protein n=1 Tax=Mycobacterium lepromatosis TaxID=480418 RepID=UPI0005F7A6F7
MTVIVSTTLTELTSTASHAVGGNGTLLSTCDVIRMTITTRPCLTTIKATHCISGVHDESLHRINSW